MSAGLHLLAALIGVSIIAVLGLACWALIKLGGEKTFLGVGIIMAGYCFGRAALIMLGLSQQ